MRKKSICARIASCAAAAVFTVGMLFTTKPDTVFADTGANEKVNAAKNGIVEIEVYYQPSGEQRMLVQTGTAFLVNNTTMVSCAHVINIDDDSQKILEEIYNDDFDQDYVDIEVVTSADVTKPVTVHSESINYDYAIMTVPENTLSTKTPLALSSSTNVSSTQDIYALGFPGIISANSNNAAHVPYVTDDVTVEPGKISKIGYSFNDGVTNGTFIQHSATLSPGNSGGPLVDANGYVIGVNKGTVESYNYALEIDIIKDQLRMSNIEFEDVDGVTTPSTTESIAVNDSEIVTAPTVTEPVPVTEPVAEITEPEEDKDDEGMNTTVIIIAAFAVVAVILIILIIVFAVKGSKKSPLSPPTNAPSTIPSGGGQSPSAMQAGGFVPQPTPQPVRPAVPVQTGFDNNSGAGETSLLNAGAGETSVLGGGAPAARAILIRKRNGTNINVNRPEFIIGKERNRVNCCINNNAVSRQHAKITSNGGVFFITDLNSSNYTYVNGIQLSPNVPQQLNNGDTIKLADEEFEFRG